MGNDFICTSEYNVEYFAADATYHPNHAHIKNNAGEGAYLDPHATKRLKNALAALYSDPAIRALPEGKSEFITNLIIGQHLTRAMKARAAA